MSSEVGHQFGLTPNRWVVTVHELKAGGQRTTTAGSLHIKAHASFEVLQRGKGQKRCRMSSQKKLQQRCRRVPRISPYFHQKICTAHSGFDNKQHKNGWCVSLQLAIARTNILSQYFRSNFQLQFNSSVFRKAKSEKSEKTVSARPSSSQENCCPTFYLIKPS